MAQISPLLAALQGAQYTPDESPLGIGAMALGQAAPMLYNPYASTGKNAAYTIGAGLLSGILGGLAKRETNTKNAELFSAMTSLRSAAPEQRATIVGENPRLADYGLLLQEQENMAAQEAALERQKREQDLYYKIEEAKQMMPIEQQKAVGSKLSEILAENGQLPIGEGGSLVDIGSLGLKSKGEIDAYNVGLKKAEELRAEADSLGYNPKLADTETALRKEFNALPEVQNFLQVEKSAKVIDQAIKDPTAVSDLELTRQAILLIEPGMAVREGEQAAVLGSQSVPEEWKGVMTKALTGQAALGPEVREGLKRLAIRNYAGNKDQYDRAFDFYSNRAAEKGLDPANLSRIGQSTDASNIFSTNNKVETKTLRDGTTVKVQRQADGSYVEVP